MTKPGELFSPLKWHSNGTMWNEEDKEDDDMEAASTKRTASTVYLIQKGRDMRSRMQALYQVRPAQEKDVLRYQVKEQQKDDSMSPSVAAKRLGPSYVPPELLQTAAKKKAPSSPEKGGAASKKKSASLTELEEIERKRRNAGEDEEGDLADVDQSYEQSDEEEEAADYTMNYYESEGDESDGGGDGGEPTF